jgi:hypothetical protein
MRLSGEVESTICLERAAFSKRPSASDRLICLVLLSLHLVNYSYVLGVRLNRTIGRQVSFGLPQLYTDAVLVLALERHITPSEYLRQVVEEDLQAKTMERSVGQFGATVGQFSRHVKEYLDVATGVTTAAGLPRNRRRDDLFFFF